MQPSPSYMTTTERAWRVEGVPFRSALPEKFLDFCGSFPIYTIEKTSINSTMKLLRRGKIILMKTIIKKSNCSSNNRLIIVDILFIRPFLMIL